MKDRSILHGKKVVLGVTGSIAAYKSAHLTRLLVKAGAEVRVVMTPDACEFITPLTLATLSKHPVHSDFTEDKEAGTWVNHVELGLWGDLILLAPCTANTLSKWVSGNADNLLLAVLLSARCPQAVAPAMDLDMYLHPSTRENLHQLEERGVFTIAPESGELASGLHGQGRLAEPEHIVQDLEKWFVHRAPLHGKQVLITAGPTHEAIDAVRFIGNHSSGKMGFALARRAAELGATTTLVTGPVHLETPHPSVNRINVTSAAEMSAACHQVAKDQDIIIMSAAVADYRPKTRFEKKLKKSDDALKIELEPTEDILKSLGEQKSENQVFIGFALETHDEITHAHQKLKRKNLDLIVLNSLQDAGAGFGHDTNKVTLIDRNNKTFSSELKSKVEIAHDIWKNILLLCNA